MDQEDEVYEQLARDAAQNVDLETLMKEILREYSPSTVLPYLLDGLVDEMNNTFTDEAPLSPQSPPPPSPLSPPTPPTDEPGSSRSP